MTSANETRTLRRNTQDGVLGGVAVGVARYFRIDPVIVRIAFIVSLFMGGIGVIAYAAAWLLVPDEHGRSAVAGGLGVHTSDDVTRVVGVVLIFFAATLVLGHWSWTGDVVLPLLLIAAGAWLLLRQRDDATADGGDRGVDGTLGDADVGDTPERPDVELTPSDTRGDGSTEVLAPPRPTRRTQRSGPPVTRVTVALVILTAGGFGLASGPFPELTLQAGLISCLAITGAGLVVGAFLGRGRRLIPLGMVLLAGLSVTAAVDIDLRGGIGERRHTPTAVSAIDDEYRLVIGEMVIDLRDLAPDDLRGAQLSIDASVAVGSLEILVPADVQVTGTAGSQLGDVTAFGIGDEGADPSVAIDRPGTEGAGTIEIDAEVGVGEVIVR